MRRPKVLINMHYMHIGGAESALVALLRGLREADLDVDLLINSHEGALMAEIPGHVRLLPECPSRRLIERPIAEVVGRGRFDIAAARLAAKLAHRRWLRQNPLPEGVSDGSIFHYIDRFTAPLMPRITGRYDLAVSFLTPHFDMLVNTNARRRAAWIHTDYTRCRVNAEAELPVWSAYDHIVAVSRQVADAFVEVFPSLKAKVCVIENILEPDVLRRKAASATAAKPAGRYLLSLGRITEAKHFSLIPEVASLLKPQFPHLKWLIVGPGDQSELQQLIEHYGVADMVGLRGACANPYGLLEGCELYVCTSLWEGKSVVVEEAKAFAKAIVTTPYPTAASQTEHGATGLIAAGHTAADVAYAIASLLTDNKLKTTIETNLKRLATAGADASVNAFVGICRDAIRPREGEGKLC